MRRLILLVALATLGFAGGAVACINDNELPNHEREFRSQYGEDGSPSSPDSRSYPREHMLGFGGGGLLLVGALALAAKRVRAKG